MYKNLSAKYYEEKKERPQKTCERYQNPSKEEKRWYNMVVSITKISQKIKKNKKFFIIIIRKDFNFEKFACL